MEFRFRASQERQPPSFLHSHPRPPPHQVQSSSIGVTVPERQSLEELERVLQVERIREEIMASRLAQKRMLEEQARHDMEMERELMMMERFQVVRCSAPLTVMPPQNQLGRRLISRELEIDQQVPLRGSPAVEAADNLPWDLITSEVEAVSEAKLPNQKLVGTKRKVDATLSQPRDWSCALCHVTMTNEDGLNDHLKGKKHQANATKLRSKKESAEPALVEREPSLVESTSKAVSTTDPEKKGILKAVSMAVHEKKGTLKAVSAMARGKKDTLQAVSTTTHEKGNLKVVSTTVHEKEGPRGGRTVRLQIDGKMHKVLEKGRFIWCMLCKAKCNSKEMMVHHLKGKKHLSEASTRNGDK